MTHSSHPRLGALAFCITAAVLLQAPPLQAHAISMSNGELSVRGDRLDFVLTIPLYEAAHTADPGQTLLDHIRFLLRGQTARMLQKACHEEPSQGNFVCAAEYALPQPLTPDGPFLDVDCTLYQVTVPNHVHLLRAEYAGKHDQAIFDYSFTRATLRFRPPTAFEIAVQQTFEGMLRAVAGPVQLLFLAALVLAARGRRELILLALMFLAGEIAATLITSHTQWQPPARFVEAAMGLSVAYMAVEILFLPQAGLRWLVAGVLGGFHGLALYLVLLGSNFRADYVLLGAALSELTAIAGIALLIWLFQRRWPVGPLVRVSSALLLVFGLTWFFLRLRT